MFEIKEADINSKDAKALIKELNQILTVITGDDGTVNFHAEDVKQNRSVFLIGYEDEIASGCGALREIDMEYGEIKRIYARKNKCGMGRQIIAALEKKATQLGYKKLFLETRIQNKHAISFYEKNGYTHCQNYGVYQGSINSYCMCKTL